MATYSWKGGNGDVSVGANWTTSDGTPDDAPGSDDTALIATGGTISGSATIGFVDVTADTTFTGQITTIGQTSGKVTADVLTAFEVDGGTTTFSAGASLIADKDTVVGFDGSGNLVIEDGASAQFHTAGSPAENGLYIAGESGLVDSATFTGPGTTIDSDSGINVGFNGTGTLTVSDDATVSMGAANDFGFYIGYNGAGTFNLSGGAQVSGATNAILGVSAGSIGQATIDGSGTVWSQTDGIEVGALGSGTLAVQNGALVSAATLMLAGDDASTGDEVTVQSGAVIDTGELEIGVGSTTQASMTIAQGGSAIVDGLLFIGEAGSAAGTLTVSGSGSLLSGITGMALGGSGAGTLSVLAGGTVDAGSAIANLGLNPQASGALIVSGGTFTAGAIDVAVSGGGTVTAANAAVISTADVGVGIGQTGSGSITLNDSATGWAIQGGLTIGGAGTGSFVDNQAALSVTGNVDLGTVSTGSGLLTIDDAAPVFSGSVSVGDSGSGTMNVDSGATVSLGSLLVGGGGMLNVNAASVTDSGTLDNQGVINIASDGVVTAEGGGIDVGGTISGAGTLDLDAGIFQLGAAPAITIASWNIDSAATVSLGGDLGYGGALALSGTIDLDGSALTLSGSATLAGAINGGGSSVIAGTAVINGLSIGGDAVVEIAAGGSAAESNDTSFIGFSPSDTSEILIDTSGSYLFDDATIQDDSNGASSIVNGGFVEISGGGAAPTNVDPKFVNTGTVQIDTELVLDGGSPDLGGTISGPGTLDNAAGAFSLNPDLALTVAAWEIDPSATLSLSADLSYAGRLIDVGGVTELDGHVLRLSGNASFAAAPGDAAFVGTGSGMDAVVVSGSGSVVTINGLSLGRDTTLELQNGVEATQLGDLTLDGASLVQIDAGATYAVSAASISGAVVLGALLVAGGTAFDGNVEGGGSEIVSSGGTADGITINGGGTAALLSGAVASGAVTFVSGAGLLQIADASPAAVADLLINGLAAGDTVDLTDVAFSAGALASASGGMLDISVGGSNYALALGSPDSLPGAQFLVSRDGNSGTDVTLAGTGGATTVDSSNSPFIVSGGIAVGDTVVSGGTMIIESGGTSIDAVVSDGGTLIVLTGGVADPTIVSFGGSEIVSAGGTDLGAQILSGGTQLDYGLANGATVSSGGLQIVLGVVSGVTVETGGEQYVGSAGTTLGAQIDGGGAEVVFGTDSGANLSGTQYDFGTASGGTTVSGAYQLVAPGATASGMTIDLGGQQYVGLGGTTLGAQVEHGGAEVVIGTDSGANLSGTQYLYGTASGGTTYGDPLSGSFIGYQLIASGATGIGMTVLAGGYQYIGSGGTAVDTDVASQGVEVIFGSDSGALISGTQYDFAYASGGTTYSGGYQLVAPAGFGTAIDMTVLAGGQQYVVGGGTASGTQVMSRGVEIVHGTDLNATISGTQYVDGPSGLASGTVVATGGYQLVGPGATISAVSISGGTIELQGGASDGTAPITFTGAGDLLLDASTSFAGTVAGFGKASLNDTIDFADIPYVAAGSAGATTIAWSQLTSGSNTSGTLMVAQGGQSADITLLGQYAAGNFTASSDGHGGTLLTDPPVTAATDPNPTVLTTAHPA